ncbi:hypothetical protein ABG067_005046 [Albugo candida]
MVLPHVSPRRPRMSELKGAQSFRASTYHINILDKKLTLLERVPVLQQLLLHNPEHESELVTALEPIVFREGENIFRQGNLEKAIYFVESGQVGLTQRQWNSQNSFNAVVARMAAMSAGKAEINVWTYEPFECFGEMSLFGVGPSEVNAVALGADGASCYVIRQHEALALFDELLLLLWFRCQLRLENTLGSCGILKHLSSQQHQYLINHCSLRFFEEGEAICRQHDKDDKMYVLVQGSVKVCYDEIIPEEEDSSIEANLEEIDGLGLDTEATAPLFKVRSVVVAEKHDICCIGEMGLLNRSRTAHVIAISSANASVNSHRYHKRLPSDLHTKCDGLDKVICMVFTREMYHNCLRLGNTQVDSDAEDAIATFLAAEWNLARNARNLHLTNPKVSHHLVKFLKTFQTAYNEKLNGDNIYSTVLRELNQKCQLSSYFDPITLRAICGISALPSLSMLRSEARRILTLAPSMRTIADVNFIARVLDTTILLKNFNIPRQMEQRKVALELSKYIGFIHTQKNTIIFEQGKVENKAFLILCGSVHIVSEDAPIRRGLAENSTGAECTDAKKPQVILATLPAGSVFGELALAASLPRSASAVAACDSDLLVIERPHIECLRKALPEVSLRHAMVDRARGLTKVSFMAQCDFMHCVRLAYDAQEKICDARHAFPHASNSLFIVQSGEVGVYLRRPIVEASSCRIMDDQSLNSRDAFKRSKQPGSVNSLETQHIDKEGLVRVATIGQHGFFLTGNLHAKLDDSEECDCHLEQNSAMSNHTSTVYMCQSEVVILELLEDRWKRIAVDNLRTLRTALIESHQWNMKAVRKQRFPIYHAIEKPWVSLSHITKITNASSQDGVSCLPSLCKKGCTCKLCREAHEWADNSLQASQLSRRLHKKSTTGNITDLMCCKTKSRQRPNKIKVCGPQTSSNKNCP